MELTLFTNEWLNERRLFWDRNSLPYNPALKERARFLRQNMTKAERKLWYEFLVLLPVPFLRQRPIDHFIVDFYCAKHKLVIELDGEQHFTDQGFEYDQQRSILLNTYQLKVLRFSNQEIFFHFKEACQKIKAELRLP